MKNKKNLEMYLQFYIKKKCKRHIFKNIIVELDHSIIKILPFYYGIIKKNVSIKVSLESYKNLDIYIGTEHIYSQL